MNSILYLSWGRSFISVHVTKTVPHMPVLFVEVHKVHFEISIGKMHADGKKSRIKIPI